MHQDDPSTSTKPAGISPAAAASAQPAVGAQPTTTLDHPTTSSSSSSTHTADSKAPAAGAKAPSSSSSSPAGGACVKLAAGSKSVTAGSAGLSAAAAAASAAFVAAKLGLADQLESALAKTPGMACLRDAEGRCCLHYAAGYGHEVRKARREALNACASWLCCT